jgi:predicted secreted protein
MKFFNRPKLRVVSLSFVIAITLLGSSSAKADFVFSEPVNLGPVINGPDDIFGSSVSSDGLELYFASNRTGGYGGYDLWVSRRGTLNESWTEPVNLGSVVNSKYDAFEPCISGDGLTLYFSDTHPPENTNRLPGGFNSDGNIWKVTRTTLKDPWEAPANIGPGVNSAHAIWPGVSADGLTLYFNSHRSGSKSGHCDLMVSGWNSMAGQFENPMFLSEINSSGGDFTPEISDAGLALFFCSNRSGGYGDIDIWMTTRSSTVDIWSAPLNLGQTINKSSGEGMPDISSDCSTLYFSSNRPEGFGRRDLWQVSIDPVVDFNGDGIVDATDMCIIVEHWGEDYALCDIGPEPWGDGIVDVQDLIVFTEYLFEVYPWADTIEANEDYDGEQIELKVDQILVVKLESNPSTGYLWELEVNNESILKQFGKVEFKSSEDINPPPGTGGWEIFHFKAISAGQMTLKLIYHRPWEEVEPLKTYSIQVTVK